MSIGLIKVRERDGLVEIQGSERLHRLTPREAMALVEEICAVLGNLTKRHLHDSVTTLSTLCGLLDVKSVHITKARKTDCPECRAAFRAQVRDRSGKQYETRAEREEQRC